MKKTMKMNNLKIISTGRYLPKNTMTNQDFEKIIDTSDEWIYTRTGIKTRHIVKDENNLDLAYNATMNAVNKINYDINKIDLIICATISSDNTTPSLANMLQAKLGLNDKDVACFDINAACTGFIYGLNIAAQMLNSGHYQTALVIGAEVLSKYIDFNDRGTCILFGDGAGAMIVENTDEDKPAYFYTSSRGDVEQTLVVDNVIKMDGKKVYQFATKIIDESIRNVFANCKITDDDIDKIIPHQANIRIIETAAKSLDIDINKFYVNIENYGNTSAASVIIALDEYLDENKKENSRILLVAFGGGFTWGAALLTF